MRVTPSPQMTAGEGLSRTGLPISFEGYGFVLLRKGDVSLELPGRVSGSVRGCAAIVLLHPSTTIAGTVDVTRRRVADVPDQIDGRQRSPSFAEGSQDTLLQPAGQAKIAMCCFETTCPAKLSERSRVAETEGFEPSVGVIPLRRFSKPLVSATHPRLLRGPKRQAYIGAIPKVQPHGPDSFRREIDSSRRRFVDRREKGALLLSQERLGEVPC